MRRTIVVIFCAALTASAWAQHPTPPAADPAHVPASPPMTAPASGTTEPSPAAAVLFKPAEVRVGDTVVLTLHAARAGRSPALRARTANEALHDALMENATEVRVEYTGTVAAIYVGGRPVVQLTPEDAARSDDASLTVHADRIAAEVRAALKAERTRSAVAGGIFNVSLAVLFAVLAVFLLRRMWKSGDRAANWLDANPGSVPALHLRSMELLGRATVRTALLLGVAAGRWVVLVSLVYAWLIATFSLFETTRGFTAQLSGALLSPLATLAARLATALPLLVIVAFALLSLALVLRAMRLFFGQLARGATTISWLPRDLAAATGTLAEIALVILALVLVAPLITGHEHGAAPRVGLLGLAALALATVPLAATAVVGAATLFGRWLSVGDWVDIGSRTGQVVHLGLLETTLRDAAGIEVRVPHLARLLHPTHVHGRAPRVVATLPVARALATTTLVERLTRALGRLGTDPVVRLVEIGEAHAKLELAVTSAATDARSACLWAALAELDAARDEPPTA